MQLNVPTPSEQPFVHQSQLLRAVLKIIGVFSLLIGTINIFAFERFDIAAFNFVSAIVALLLLIYFQRSKQLLRTSWLTCAAVTFNVLMFIHLANGESYSVLWVMILPPIMFFLLGRAVGAWLTAALFLYVIVFMALQLPSAEPRAFSISGLLNITEVCIALWFLFRFYEGSRESAYRQLERQSMTDKLTGLYNRIKLDAVVAEQHQLVSSGQLKRSIVVIADIDDFKSINDQLGHIQGDKVLQHAATLLRNFTRDDGIIGRWGGEEFMLILPNYTLTQAQHYSDLLRRYIADHGTPFAQPLTMSFGLAELGKEIPAEQTFIRADRALYRAKEAGRNCVKVAHS
ncbi:putative diguanylate cyclase YedQ [Pseudidiomarina piscicola]|uniref:diguanylate cyclase n=1 Tax=Pseudidiomarina piscicola TaxID=2614830 RepID=A0A6S6WPR5_9GAMM|nr:GGDEF domain-containing protein [Pseudidiomarina piscicola]CAB0151736.1 putative diguanylate cyclase YedQ [Pseudidiomarina piscicola]VZT41193.1 putative diguanylate cyclase YedQ [Pseudomonas aeruginosa]